MSNGLLLVIIIPALLALFVGLPLYIWSNRRQQRAQEQARASMSDMPLAELQSQNLSLTFERRVFRDLLLSPEAVEWMELLVRRTFQQPDLPENYAFLVDKYTLILKQLVECLQPWADAWTAKGSEPVDEIRLRVTDSQWSSHLLGFDETVAWVAKLAAEQSGYAARLKDCVVPQWDEAIPSAECKLELNGFNRNWILTTRFHGASVAPEISRISQPLVPRAVVNEPKALLKDGAKDTPTLVAAAKTLS